MNSSIRINQNDFGLKLTFLCRDEDGNPIDLSGFSVDFLLYIGSDLQNTDHTGCVKTDAPMGIVEYTIQASDTDTSGILHGKIQLGDAATKAGNLNIIPIEII